MVPRSNVAVLRQSFKEPPHVLQQSESHEFSHIYDLKDRLTVLDRLDIEVQVVTLPQSLSHPPPHLEVKLFKAVNESLSEIQERSRGRIRPAAALPLAEPDAAVEELERANKQLGLNAVQLFSNVRGRPLDSQEFLPLFERIAHNQILVLLHPTEWDYYEWIDEFRIGTVLGWPFDTSVAMSRLVFAGLLQRYPNLKIITHHLGGMIPYYAERIQSFHLAGAFLRTHRREASLPKPPLDYFKLFYADTCVNGAVASLTCAYSFFGPDHILFGTDYPFGPEKGDLWVKKTIQSVKAMGINDEEKLKIFSGNARAILPGI